MEEQNWIFTFGFNQKHEGYYCIIFGSYENARDRMVEKFGDKWAFQYPSKEAAGVKEFNLKELKWVSNKKGA